MTDPPTDRDRCGLLLVQLQRLVMPATLEACLQRLNAALPPRIDPDYPALIGKLGVIRNDRQFAYFVAEEATVEEAIEIWRAFRFLHEVAKESQDDSVAALKTGLFDTPLAVEHVIRVFHIFAMQLGQMPKPG